jgi:hypothetical protein
MSASKTHPLDECSQPEVGEPETGGHAQYGLVQFLQTRLRVSPGGKAGFTNRGWTLEELLGVA